MIPKILKILTLFLATVILSTPGKNTSAQGTSRAKANRDTSMAAGNANAVDKPYTTQRVHDAGNLHMTISNWGTFGNPFGLYDPQTGQRLPGISFPTGYGFEYLISGELWIGVVDETLFGDDTLVSKAGFSESEFYPETFGNGGDFTVLSEIISSPDYDPEARSAQDFICEYTDTITDLSMVPVDPVSMKLHKPLRVRVRQSSFVWPYDYAENFVIIQYWIVNLRNEPLHKMRVGLTIVPGVYQNMNKNGTWQDDMVGFLPTAPSITGFDFEDSVMVAWWADNDGDPYRGGWSEQSVRSAIGLRFLGVGRDHCDPDLEPLEYSFNWWAGSGVATLDWGPQRKPGDPSIYGGLGAPIGDAQSYRFMANQEIDYGQHLANENEVEEQGWVKSPGIRYVSEGSIFNIADGHSVQLLYSVGPFELAVGDSMPIAVALIGGDFLHRSARNRFNLNRNPEAWYDALRFDELSRNAQWAAWVYDNPGIDTDGDGCAGSSRLYNCRDTTVYHDSICLEWRDSLYCWTDVWWLEEVCDTVGVAGDGIPDLKGPPPPPSPRITIHAEPSRITIRWDGRDAELNFDNFAQDEDFEGYNVYGGVAHNPNSMSLMASWDLVNYDRHRWVPQARPSPWVVSEPPFTMDDLAVVYGPDFNPKLYPDPRSCYQDEVGRKAYFTPHGGNRGNEYFEGDWINTNPVRFLHKDSLWDDQGQRWRIFGVYECTIDNLLPSQPYYLAVTAFDYGLPRGGLGPLESAIQNNMQLVYPTYSPDYLETDRLNVVVYPNPYRIDAAYRVRGYEDPNREGFPERVRRIHFANLPPEATIKIFSIDGDLIKEFHHPDHLLSDSPSHSAWDLISRNTQAVTSGIYLFSVESAWGSQVGKFVIIK